MQTNYRLTAVSQKSNHTLLYIVCNKTKIFKFHLSARLSVMVRCGHEEFASRTPRCAAIMERVSPALKQLELILLT